MIYTPAELRVYAHEITLPDFTPFVWARLAHHLNGAYEPYKGATQAYIDILKLTHLGLLEESKEPCDHPRWLYASEAGRDLYMAHHYAAMAMLDWNLAIPAKVPYMMVMFPQSLDAFFASIAPTHCAGCDCGLPYTEIREAIQHRNLCEDCNGKHGRCTGCHEPFINAFESRYIRNAQDGYCDQCWSYTEEIPSDPRKLNAFYGVFRD